MNEKLKELLKSTLNVAEEYYYNIHGEYNKYDFLEDIISDSSLNVEVEKLDKILREEISWY